MKNFFFSFGCTMLVLLLILFFWFFIKKNQKQGFNIILSSYFECGFEKSHKSRQSFSLRFFFILILFVIFDVELMLLLQLPFHTQNYMKCREGLFFFFLVLGMGLFEEWRRGLLNWKN